MRAVTPKRASSGREAGVFRSEHNGSREVGNMPRNIPDAIFPVSGRHMHDGVEENQSFPLSFTPFAYPYPPLLRNRSISPEVTTASQKMGSGKRSDSRRKSKEEKEIDWRRQTFVSEET